MYVCVYIYVRPSVCVCVCVAVPDYLSPVPVASCLSAANHQTELFPITQIGKQRLVQRSLIELDHRLSFWLTDL